MPLAGDTLAICLDASGTGTGETHTLTDIASVMGWGTLTATAENKDTVNMVPGMPIARHPSGTGFIRANASSLSTQCLGLCVALTAPGFAAKIKTAGVMELADWTPIVGAVSLGVMATYYLSNSSPGTLTLTPPVSVGSIVQKTGESISPTQMLIELQPLSVQL